MIERDARKQLGIQPGDRAIETVERGRLVVTFLPAPHRRSLRGSLRGSGRVESFADYRDSTELGDALESERNRDR